MYTVILQLIAELIRCLKIFWDMAYVFAFMKGHEPLIYPTVKPKYLRSTLTVILIVIPIQSQCRVKATQKKHFYS